MSSGELQKLLCYPPPTEEQHMAVTSLPLIEEHKEVHIITPGAEARHELKSGKSRDGAQSGKSHNKPNTGSDKSRPTSTGMRLLQACS